MSRRIQIFTRLTAEQTRTLDRIGRERKMLIERNGMVNRSEVIRALLAEADDRLFDDSPRERGIAREIGPAGDAIEFPWSAASGKRVRA